MVGSPVEMARSRRHGRARTVVASPISLLVGSAALAVGTAALILTRHPRIAGFVALLAATALLAGSSSAQRDGGPAGRFAEQVADRTFDACLLAPLAWVLRLGAARPAVVALVALGASFVASYERARGESLGYRGHEGLGYRALRAALLVAGLLSGWLEATLWLYVILTLAATAARAWNVVLQQRRVGAELPPAGTSAS